MKKIILYSLIISFFSVTIACSPEQEDADPTLTELPPPQLSPAELATKNDTSKCVFSTGNGRVTVTVDNGVNTNPTVPRGYFDYFITNVSSNSIDLIHYGGSYDDFMYFTFYNRSGSGLYDVSPGVYGTNSYYGNGRVEITGSYMYKGSYGETQPLSGQKVYVKALNDGSGGYDVIFCNFKMRWEYYYDDFTTITLNGKIRVN